MAALLVAAVNRRTETAQTGGRAHIEAHWRAAPQAVVETQRSGQHEQRRDDVTHVLDEKAARRLG